MALSLWILCFYNMRKEIMAYILSLKNVEMKEINLNIQGMHCTGCSSRLQKFLNNLDGVESANVSFEEKKANIKYNESITDIIKIKEAIAEFGFKGE